MARRARRRSNSGFYHIVTRGVDRITLFEDDADFRYYLALLERYTLDLNINIHAYCLMSNHVHLLLSESADHLPCFMKKIGVSYAAYFNEKYERVGHLFQDRYRSEPIENPRYLLLALRYILLNPEAAGLCPCSAYPWSSFRLYRDTASFVDTSPFEDSLGSVQNYIEFIKQTDENDRAEFLDYLPLYLHDDAWAVKTARDVLHIDNPADLRRKERAEREQGIILLFQAGLSGRQIARITGICRAIVQRVLSP